MLLDNFSGAIADARKTQERDKLKSSGLDRTEHVLDPLLELLCQYESEDDLLERIEHLFYSLIGDADCEILTPQVAPWGLGVGVRCEGWRLRGGLGLEA